MASIHDVPPDAFNYVWDNSIEPVLEIESGESVQLHVRDASDEQIHKGSGVEDVAKLDFSHVPTRSAGPVFVKGAKPGDILEVELLAFEARTGAGRRSSPASGSSRRVSRPVAPISEVDATAGLVRFGEAGHAAAPPVPGHARVRNARAGEHSIVPPSRFGGNMDIKHLRHGVKPLPAGRGRGSAVLTRRHACGSGGRARSAARRSRPRWT
jgi:acetamidase/formamidase